MLKSMKGMGKLSVFVLQLASSVWSQPLFVDQTREAGLLSLNTFGGHEKRYILEAHGSGAGFFDYDRDGDLDLYVVNGSTFETYDSPSAAGNVLFRNQGDGRFEDVTMAAKVGDTGWGAGVAVGDVDNDGHRDLYVTNYAANVLYRNEGEGRFEDVTRTAGVAGDDYSTSAVFFDYDNDGDLDLYVVNYVLFDIDAVPDDPAADPTCMYQGGIRVFCGPRGMEGGADVLYRNEGDGRFADRTLMAGIAASGKYYGLGVVPADYNNDGNMDLFVANDETPNVLFRNNGDGTFADVAPVSGVAYNADGEKEAGMGVSAGDYDNDGDTDFYVSNFYRETNTLYRNEGANGFSDMTEMAGLAAATLNLLGWGTHFLDYDNDGDLDLFVANGHVYPQVDRTGAGDMYAQTNQLFANTGTGRFVEVTDRSGSGLRVVKVSRGSCLGDYDNDGDIDLFVVNLNDTPTLLRNDGGNERNYLMVQVVGERMNRDGVGARIRVLTALGNQWRTINGASGYLGHSDIRAHFGLGHQQRVDWVEILWPDSTTTSIQNVPANNLLTVRQSGGHELRQP